MKVVAVRLINFMAFEDFGWIELRPIMFIYGRNSSGKGCLRHAFDIMHDAIFYNHSSEQVTIRGIQGFSKFIHDGIKLDAPSNQISFCFRCIPDLGLISKVNDFSYYRDLDIREEDTAEYTMTFTSQDDLDAIDIGKLCSVSINLSESRSLKNPDGNWTTLRNIILIESGSTNNQWTFRSEILNLQAASEL